MTETSNKNCEYILHGNTFNTKNKREATDYLPTRQHKTTMQPPPATAVFEKTSDPNMLFSTSNQTHTNTETNTSKRGRSSSPKNHSQPPSKIRKESQDLVNKLNGLNTVLTKNVAKGVSKVFNVQANVKGSIAMHTGGVMYVYVNTSDKSVSFSLF